MACLTNLEHFAKKKYKVNKLIERSNGSPGFLKIGTIEEDFQQPSSLEMIAEIMEGLICISHSRHSVLTGKSSKDT